MQPAPSVPVRRPALWPLLLAYLAAFLFALVASAAYIVVAVLPHARTGIVGIADDAARFALSAPGLLGSALVDAAVLAVVTGTAGLLMRPKQGGTRAARLVSHLRLGPTRATPLGLAAAVVGMAGLSLACSAAANLVGVGHEGVMESIARVLAASSPLKLVLALFAIGVAPGFAEEGFFRGLMQTRLRARWGPWPAIVLSAFAFGLFHVDPLQGSLAFVAGIFLGWVVERFGGIRPSIVAHAVNNAMFVLLASFADPVEHATRAATIGTLAAGATVCAGAIAVIRSRFAVLP